MNKVRKAPSGAENRKSRHGSSLRHRVFQRDRGICALCGIDAVALGRALEGEWQRVKLARTPRERRERAEFRQRFRWYFRRATCWDADHIVPVSEGGGSTLENLRTLCVPCHQQVTKELARRRASQRRQRRAGPKRRIALGIIE